MKQFDIQSVLQGSLPVNFLPSIEVMGQDVVNTDADQATDAILAPGRRKVFFLNAHCANVARVDADYNAAISRAEMLLPDGIGVELAARMTGEELVANLNGTDLTPVLLRKAARSGMSVYLLGGRPGTAEAAARHIAIKTPGLRVAGTSNGYDDVRNRQSLIEDINASGADILLVAMGVPMQELWIEENFADLKPRVALAVGGLFDFWAGNVPRAPLAVRKARLEWGWRLMMEPRRMAKRYLIGNFTFMAHAALWAARGKSRFAIGKRFLDIALSAMAIAILAPLFALVFLAIRLESRGPVVFRQERIGHNGKSFTLYKLRSMYVDAEARRAALLATSDRDGVCFKSKSDPRVTRVGRILRRFSIDELPQIFNILLGQMSIVGPRPALPEEVSAYPERALKRLAAKPGLTGLWQVSGRADIGFEQMIEMDLAYVRARSMWLDILLIALTFRTVVTGRGAY
jgi:exopolysaccharide biosynthesis WecB/TagA/CpsF family protein